MRKVCIVCAGFKRENLHKQPWAYIKDIAETLSLKDFDVVIVTNGQNFRLGDVKIIGIPRLWKGFSFLGYTSEAINAIKNEHPDVIVEIIGPSSFIKGSSELNDLGKELGIPIIGILMAPLYKISEIVRVGLRELLVHYSYILPNATGALIPSMLIRKKSFSYSKIVVLTQFNRKRLIKKGVSTPIVVIPPKIRTEWFYHINTKLKKKIREEINPGNIPLVAYFTSPLTLRGTDTLILSFSRINKELRARLIFLSRQDKKARKEEARLFSLADKLDLQNVIIISKTLSLEELRAYLSVATVIALPFKIIISDFPLSILEAMALKKPVISTNVGGIPETLEYPQVVQPNNVEDLARHLRLILSDPKTRKKLIKKNYLTVKRKNKLFDEKIMKLIAEVV